MGEPTRPNVLIPLNLCHVASGDTSLVLAPDGVIGVAHEQDRPVKRLDSASAAAVYKHGRRQSPKRKAFNRLCLIYILMERFQLFNRWHLQSGLSHLSFESQIDEQRYTPFT